MNEHDTEPMGKRAKEFENYLIGWVKRLGFKDVNGGPNFVVGGVQVDACGAHEDTLIVVECQTAGKRTKRSVRDDIRRVRRVIQTLRKGFKAHSTYNKYSHLKYVLACKGIEFPESDLDFANEGQQVYVWDEQVLEYYEALARIISEYARFSLMGELGVKPRVKSLISVPALRCKLDKYVAYSFMAQPEKLLRVAYVARREVGNEKYYQRILKRDRLAKIERFIKKGGIFPNNIILSFQRPPTFKPIKQEWKDWPDWIEFGVLTFPETYRSCWIIDGQHRLYSFSKLNLPAKIPVLGFERLELDRQAQFFVEINKEQKPVDPDLLWDLEGDMRPNNAEGVVSNTVKMLATSNALIERIYIPLRGRRKRGQLKFSAMCNAITAAKLTESRSRTMIGGAKNPLYDNDPRERARKVSKALASYFEALEAKLSNLQRDTLLLKNTSMDVLISFFEAILSHLCCNPTKENLQMFASAIRTSLEHGYSRESDLRRLLERCASKGGRSEVLKELVGSVRDIIKEPDFGQLIGPHRDEPELTSFERHLAKFILEALSVTSLDELRSVAPPELCKRVASRLNGSPDERLTLGECVEIIFHGDNWPKLKDCFLHPSTGFSDRKELESALTQVSAYRNKIKHGRLATIRYKEPEIARVYMDKISKCIDAYNSVTEGYC